MASDRESLCDALRAAGVRGVDDFGRFVNTKYFRASEFDDAAAAPVLLAELPSVSDGSVVAAIARHLRRVRLSPRDFDRLLVAFERWATENFDAGWTLGDALAHAARPDHVATMCQLAQRQEYGRSRQMIVFALWRWRRSELVEPTLRGLLADPDVAMHAMSALNRVIPADDMLAALAPLLQNDADPTVRKQAQCQATPVRRRILR